MSHNDIVLLNNEAPENMDAIVVTRDVFHDDRSALKVLLALAPLLLVLNNEFMAVTKDVSQVEILPYVAVAAVEFASHALTAAPILVVLIAVNAKVT